MADPRTLHPVDELCQPGQLRCGDQCLTDIEACPEEEPEPETGSGTTCQAFRIGLLTKPDASGHVELEVRHFRFPLGYGVSLTRSRAPPSYSIHSIQTLASAYGKGRLLH